MPRKFFEWVGAQGGGFEYRFLNNNVPKGEPMDQAGYGTREHLSIANVQTFIDISRYARVDIHAKSPEELYPDPDVCTVEENAGFIRKCVQAIPYVDFVDEQTQRPYAHVEDYTKPGVLDMDVFLGKL